MPQKIWVLHSLNKTKEKYTNFTFPWRLDKRKYCSLHEQFTLRRKYCEKFECVIYEMFLQDKKPWQTEHSKTQLKQNCLQLKPAISNLKGKQNMVRNNGTSK